MSKITKIKNRAQKYLHETYGEWQGQGSDERAKIFMAFEAGWISRGKADIEVIEANSDCGFGKMEFIETALVLRDVGAFDE